MPTCGLVATLLSSAELKYWKNSSKAATKIKDFPIEKYK